MGGEHKVRNFYNNLVDPDGEDGDVTIDSHALAASWMRYLALPAKLHGLGLGPAKGKQPKGWKGAIANTGAGTSGTYAIYADAYRELAEEVGMLPDELQAVVWVVKRNAFINMFPDNIEAVDDEWRKFQSGKQELQATQDAVWDISQKDRAEHAKYERLGTTRGAYKKQQESEAKAAEKLEARKKANIPGKPVRKPSS